MPSSNIVGCRRFNKINALAAAFCGQKPAQQGQKAVKSGQPDFSRRLPPPADASSNFTARR